MLPMQRAERASSTPQASPSAHENTEKPLVSVVTAVYNGATWLRRAMESVFTQTYPHIEYVVIDGGSRDGTITILREYEDRLAYWCSESDHGIADAFNKGIRASHGAFHILLNADDWWEPRAVEQLVNAVSPDTVVACAHARLVTPYHGSAGILISEPRKLYWKMSLVHGTCLMRTEAWRELGGYRVDKRIAMDHHLMLGAYQRYGPKAFRVAEALLVNYQLGGVSDRRIRCGFEEVRENIRQVTGRRWRANLAFALLLAKHYSTRLRTLRAMRTWGKSRRLLRSESAVVDERPVE